MAFAADGEFEMSRKRRKPEKIVAKLRRLGCRRLSVWPRHPQQDGRHITDLVKAGIQNTLAKNQSNSGGFTLSRRGVGRQA
jgi:hypothetical protein